MPSIRIFTQTALILSSVATADASLPSHLIEFEHEGSSDGNRVAINEKRSLSFFDLNPEEEPSFPAHSTSPQTSSSSAESNSLIDTDAFIEDNLNTVVARNSQYGAKCPYKDFNKFDECSAFNLTPTLEDGDCLFDAGDNGWTCHWESKEKCKKNAITEISGCKESCIAYHKKCCCPAAKYSPTMSPTIYCKYREYIPNQKFCSQYNTAVGKDCIFDAGKTSAGCAKTARRQCDEPDFRRIVGCVDSCAKFHEDCCCPPEQNGANPGFTSDSFPPTISPKPTESPTDLPTENPSTSPTRIPTHAPTANPSAKPSMVCPWSGFGLLSRCNQFVPYLGGDCWFDAKDDYGNCANVSFKGCYREEVLEINDCFDVCTQFHFRCCCPPQN